MFCRKCSNYRYDRCAEGTSPKFNRFGIILFSTKNQENQTNCTAELFMKNITPLPLSLQTLSEHLNSVLHEKS